MPVTDAYATAATYRAMFQKTDTSQDAAILDDLTAVSRYLERRLGRFFTQDANVVVRTYRPATPYTRTLFVDDISTSSGLIVKIDDNRDGTAETTLTLATDFELVPRNAATGPEPAPYTQLYIPERASRLYWIELVETTSKGGWPAVPKAIERGTCQLTGIWRIESPRATNQISVGLDAVLGASAAAQAIVQDLVDSYAKPAWVFS